MTQQEQIMEPEKETESVSGLALVIDRVLDKGVVINADIVVSVADAELLGIKIRAALASFRTAAQYGLQFPAGTNQETAAWRDAVIDKEDCPQCRKMVEKALLLDNACPWCGWQSAKAKIVAKKRVVV